jgi:hypothetical protein
MRRLLAVAALILPLVNTGGCSWQGQANRSSQAVDIDPWRNPAIVPANGPGYVDGVPQDMRTKR